VRHDAEMHCLCSSLLNSSFLKTIVHFVFKYRNMFVVMRAVKLLLNVDVMYSFF